MRGREEVNVRTLKRIREEKKWIINIRSEPKNSKKEMSATTPESKYNKSKKISRKNKKRNKHKEMEGKKTTF